MLAQPVLLITDLIPSEASDSACALHAHTRASRDRLPAEATPLGATARARKRERRPSAAAA